MKPTSTANAAMPSNTVKMKAKKIATTPFSVSSLIRAEFMIASINYSTIVIVKIQWLFTVHNRRTRKLNNGRKAWKKVSHYEEGIIISHRDSERSAG